MAAVPRKTAEVGSAGLPSVEQFSLLFELSRAFSTLTDLEILLPLIMAKAKEVLQAENCAVLLLDAERQELFFPAVSDVSPAREASFKNLRFPATMGIAGAVLRQGKPLLISDVTHDGRFYAGVDQVTGARTQELIYAPLRAQHGIFGVIGLRNKLEGRFTEADLAFLDALAGPIAVAIANSQLYQQVRQSEARLREEVATLHREVVHLRRYTELIGTGPAMTKVLSLMESAIVSPVTVLLEGETGTGKEQIARVIHRHGPRKDAPFVAVNCGALPDTLIESELFGHKKGAFTGAMQDQMGLFEAAHHGTIFLDEIGETTPAMQVKLLRVLQEGEFRRLGETRTRRVDVRVIAATNKDLAQEIRQKRFREDLYYRLSIFPIQVPPLRERLEDIPLLAAHFLRRSTEKLGKQLAGITQESVTLLTHYAWPGNVRELENAIERAVALTPEGSPITPPDLPERITTSQLLHSPLSTTLGPLQQARLTFEREYIAEVLRQHQGNATQAARILGISRQMLQQKIKAYDLRATA